MLRHADVIPNNLNKNIKIEILAPPGRKNLISAETAKICQFVSRSATCAVSLSERRVFL